MKLTWEDVDNTLAAVANANKNNGWTAIYGVPRGGFIPATILSHMMNLPLLISMDEVINQPRGSKSVILIVDDIWDTGKTLTSLQKDLLVEGLDIDFIFYTLVSKEINPKCQYSVLVEPEVWVKFPWETTESSVEIPKSWKND